MSTTTTWSINELERHTAGGIVYTVHYRVDATDGTYKAGAYGSVGPSRPPVRDMPSRPQIRRRGLDTGAVSAASLA